MTPLYSLQPNTTLYLGYRPDCSYLKHWSSIDVDSVVVHHFHNGHTKIATNPEWDAEAQSAKDGDDVALRKTTTTAVQQWGRTRCWCHRAPILRQFNVLLLFYIATINFPKVQIAGKKNSSSLLSVSNVPKLYDKCGCKMWFYALLNINPASQ